MPVTITRETVSRVWLNGVGVLLAAPVSVTYSFSIRPATAAPPQPMQGCGETVLLAFGQWYCTACTHRIRSDEEWARRMLRRYAQRARAPARRTRKRRRSHGQRQGRR